MLSTDAYAFLNIRDPVCAWATYRSVLVCAQPRPGFLSVWSAGILRMDDAARINRELVLESVRASQFPERISRLRGMFCFLDVTSAEKACSWSTGPNSHFRPEFLAELSLSEAGERRDRLDSNWISFAPRTDQGYLTTIDWVPHCWAGTPYPGHTPVWETLIDGRLIVLGTTLKERAYQIIKTNFPASLAFLEIGRQAAWVGSDLGNVFAYLREDGDDLVLEYALDMRDAEDPAFLEKLQQLKQDGHPINWADLTPI
jgi:hypothetical protein